MEPVSSSRVLWEQTVRVLVLVFLVRKNKQQKILPQRFKIHTATRPANQLERCSNTHTHTHTPECRCTQGKGTSPFRPVPFFAKENSAKQQTSLRAAYPRSGAYTATAVSKETLQTTNSILLLSSVIRRSSLDHSRRSMIQGNSNADHPGPTVRVPQREALLVVAVAECVFGFNSRIVITAEPGSDLSSFRH